MTDAEKDHIRWIVKSQMGGFHGWEEYANNQIAESERNHAASAIKTELTTFPEVLTEPGVKPAFTKPTKIRI